VDRTSPVADCHWIQALAQTTDAPETGFHMEGCNFAGPKYDASSGPFASTVFSSSTIKKYQLYVSACIRSFYSDSPKCSPDIV
jgi:hypothetical protein